MWPALLGCGQGFHRFLEGHGQQPFTGLITNLYPELVLLVGRQIIPVRNDRHEDLGDPSCSIPRRVSVRQVKALGILDAIVLIADEQMVLGHSSRNISQQDGTRNLLIGIGSGMPTGRLASWLIPSNSCKDRDQHRENTQPKG